MPDLTKLSENGEDGCLECVRQEIFDRDGHRSVCFALLLLYPGGLRVRDGCSRDEAMWEAWWYEERAEGAGAGTIG